MPSLLAHLFWVYYCKDARGGVWDARFANPIFSGSVWDARFANPIFSISVWDARFANPIFSGGVWDARFANPTFCSGRIKTLLITSLNRCNR